MEQRKLTDRQLQVVVYLANGYRMQEIADALHFSRSSLEVTLRRARKRMRARTTTHLVSLVIATGALEWNSDTEIHYLNGNGKAAEAGQVTPASPAVS